MRASTALRAILCPSSFARYPGAKNGYLCHPHAGGATGRRRSQGLRRLGFCRALSSVQKLESSSPTSKVSGSRRINCGPEAEIADSNSNAGIWGGNGHRSGREMESRGIWQHRSIQGPRKLWTTSPLQMGRRSSKIATRKGAQDRKKAKLYGKIGKQIVSAVKEGGPSPTANAVLANLLTLAKQYDVPKEIIDRNMKKASDKSQADFVETTFEVYGLGGVGLVLEVLTDNNNRAAANIRDVVKKGGGKMADPGSVLFNFKRTGVVYVEIARVSGDELLMAAMDAGAEDVLEPPVYEDEDEDDGEAKFYRVLTPADQFSAVSQSLKEAGMPVDSDHSGLELFPVAAIEPDDEAMDLNKALMEKLLDLDDVDAVYSNQK